MFQLFSKPSVRVASTAHHIMQRRRSRVCHFPRTIVTYARRDGDSNLFRFYSHANALAVYRTAPPRKDRLPVIPTGSCRHLDARCRHRWQARRVWAPTCLLRRQSPPPQRCCQ